MRGREVIRRELLRLRGAVQYVHDETVRGMNEGKVPARDTGDPWLGVSAGRQLGYRVRELPEPMRFGEDFGFFTRKFKGAMFGLGAGLEAPPLHSQAYDFPDALLATGTALLKGIIGGLLDKAGDHARQG